MIRAIADTHAVIWYLRSDERLSAKAQEFIEQAANQGEHVGFSSITLVEMVYLVEKGRIEPDALERFQAAVDAANSVWQEVSLTGEIAYELQKIPRETVPDMPDRIIAATASVYRVPVISRDRKIKVSEIETIW